MEGFQHQSKEGSRGGSGGFSWEDIKTEKYVNYEQYLGHSVMAPIGRWQKNQDITWFNKAKKGEEMSASQRAQMERLRIEKEMIKQQEADLQAEALGLGPAAKRVLGASNITKQDLAEVLGTTKREGETGPSAFESAARIKGVGYQGNALISRSEKQERALGLRTFDGPGTASGGMKLQLGEVPGASRRLSNGSEAQSPDKTVGTHVPPPQGVAHTSANLAPLGFRPAAYIAKKPKKDKKDKKDKKHKKHKKHKKSKHRDGNDSDDNKDHPRRDDDRDRTRRPARSPSPSRRRRHDSRSPVERRRSRSPPPRRPASGHDRSPPRRRRSRSPPRRRRSRSPPPRHETSKSPPRRARHDSDDSS